MEFRIDGHPIELKAWQDLSWLGSFGRVFRVFDRLTSGNLCFGVEAGEGRRFVKYAGARTANYAGKPEAAVTRLMEAAPKYRELAHPCLSPIVHETATPEGYALVFPWFDGLPLGPLPEHLASFRSLPLLTRLALYDSMADFIVKASARDFVAAGLWDNGILARLDTPRTMFCSVDHYIRMPAHTPWGKLPGAPWYVPPEGYIPGALLAEAANVYAMGALAFTFFAGRGQRAMKNWEAGAHLFHVATKALSEKPDRRYTWAAEYLAAWRDGVMRLDIPSV